MNTKKSMPTLIPPVFLFYSPPYGDFDDSQAARRAREEFFEDDGQADRSLRMLVRVGEEMTAVRAMREAGLLE